ncbi:MAG: OmpH family outer membrane protein [Paracoccus sp. (in: a-proteobacteria)]|uniref:OmpH family outer membrane protein n=1 Tax=Paracoccus sp. TaxID=267 RepID=UPI0026E02F15|nr:OmpH family outer membrane protein [Paracoccus sp. (in: a-proteobacteria)]MDO5622391.1 OmpH family outer membrane protein [Paracoccus sp. (in: a-proteobacteria)]
MGLVLMRRVGSLALLSVLVAGPGSAQQVPPPALAAPEVAPVTIPEALPDGAEVPVLTVDRDRLYLESAWGQRAMADYQAAARELATENDRLAAQLSQEEAALTESRATLPPEEFRSRARAFDERATTVRAERAAALRQLNQDTDNDRAQFLQTIGPVIADEMRRRGAVVMLDQRTVFLSISGIDATEDLIARINTEIGDGSAAD